MKKLLVAILSLLVRVISFAAEHEVGQKNRKFTTKYLTIKPGNRVHFLNNDMIYHNIFSLSDFKKFDLGYFPKGESRSVTSKKVGVYDIECAIHPDMQLRIEVKQ